MAPSRVAHLTQRVESDPLDGEAWLALIGDAEQKGDLERTRSLYEDFLKVFPDATHQWIGYANLELSHGLFENVEAIFARCLRESTAVELWKFYIAYIRRVNPIDPSQPDQAKEARAVIAKSFEYALQHVGVDRTSGDMWIDYINFLKEGQSRGTWEEQQRMDALRKAYQRAVCVPLNNVEAIWQEYNAFENNLNKLTARKFIAELSPSYMTARKALRELRAQFDRLPTPLLPHRPTWSPASGEDRQTIEGWKKYLKYEEGNPLDIEEPGALQSRVNFAYKKALGYLRFFPEVWYSASEYYSKLGNVEQARALLQAGVVANPSSLLLAYTLADLEEGCNDFPAATKSYDSILEHFETSLNKIHESTENAVTTALAEYDAQRASEAETAGEGGEGEGGDGEGKGKEDAEGREQVALRKEEIKKDLWARREREIEGLKKSLTHGWITYMRFTRRAEGFKSFRNAFTKARKSKYVTWQIYEASAEIELHEDNAPTATKVYQLGQKKFPEDVDFILSYMDFLIRVRDAANLRVLFKTTTGSMEPALCKAIWDKMAEYEYRYSDYLVVQTMLTSYANAFPEASLADRFALRHGYRGLNDVMAEDLGILPSRSQPRSRSRSRSLSVEPNRKRGLSVEPPRGNYERPDSVDPSAGGAGVDEHGQKRLRPNVRVEASPAPSSSGGWTPNARGGEEGGVGRRVVSGPPPPSGPGGQAFGANRPIPFALDPRGENLALLPEAVVYFLSILPPASSFDGPRLDPVAIMNVIGSTLLPGTAPGPGLPGERLGIPPRQKPRQGSRWDNNAPPQGGYGGRGNNNGYGPPRRY